MKLYSPVISGSLTVTGSTTFIGNITMSGSLSATASNALLLNGTGSVGFTTTGSFTTMSGSVSTRVSQIESVYATTGSNSFRATQSITGSLTVTGQIIAQTLNVQQVTSSIVFSSGSNVFGCDLNSRQVFTGSFYQTGSIAIFTSCVGIGTNSPSAQLDVASNARFFSAGNWMQFETNVLTSLNNDGAHIRSVISTAANPTYTWKGDTDTGMYSDTANTISFSTSGSNRLTISCTGAATFSNSFTTSDTPVLFLSPNLGTNQSLFLQLGKNISSTYNSGEVSFKYVGNGSTSNMVSLGFYGSGQKLNVLGDGNVGIGITPSYKLDVNNGASGVVLNLEGANAYNAETGILMSSGRAKISGFLNGTGGTPGTSLRFFTMPDQGSVTERLRIDGSGNVGIGSCPSYKLDIHNGSDFDIRLRDTSLGGTVGILFETANDFSGTSQAYIKGVGAGNSGLSDLILGTSCAVGSTSAIERMRITSAGRVGIGVSSPETLFDVADSSSNTLIAVRNTSTANTTGKNAMYGFVGTDTVGTPKLVGGMQAVPNDVNWVNGLLYWYVRAGDGQALRMSLSSSGALVISGALTQNGSPSDINLKQNLVKITSPLEKISQINGYNFEWKEGSPARGNISNIVEDAGVIAQEIEQVMPEIVRTSDDNKVVNYNGLVGLLIEGMKAQQCTINTLKTCIGIA